MQIPALMNPLTFQVKRAHWRLWSFASRLLRPFGTTPARLDMLQAIDELEAPTQTRLARKLGLTKGTVSEMLDLLQVSGFVHRLQSTSDLRCKIVRLTELGRALLGAVFRVLVRSGLARKASAFALVDPLVTLMRNRQMKARTRDIQFALGDSATFSPVTVPIEEIDEGAPLEGDERELYQKLWKRLYRSFTHLPVRYVLSN